MKIDALEMKKCRGLHGSPHVQRWCKCRSLNLRTWPKRLKVIFSVLAAGTLESCAVVTLQEKPLLCGLIPASFVLCTDIALSRSKQLRIHSQDSQDDVHELDARHVCHLSCLQVWKFRLSRQLGSEATLSFHLSYAGLIVTICANAGGPS